MPHSPMPLAAALIASVAAGPLFVTSLSLAIVYLRLPQPIVVSAAEAGAFAGALTLASVFGFILGLVPNIVGALIMSNFSERVEELRSPVAWMGAGALFGGCIALLANLDRSEPEMMFALIFTSVACAWISWAYLLRGRGRDT